MEEGRTDRKIWALIQHVQYYRGSVHPLEGTTERLGEQITRSLFDCTIRDIFLFLNFAESESQIGFYRCLQDQTPVYKFPLF